MTSLQVLDIARDLMLTTLLLSAPALAASLVVGLAVSILQTVTSIQEQTLSFAPRLAAVLAAMLLTLPWSLRVLEAFTLRMITVAAGAGR